MHGQHAVGVAVQHAGAPGQGSVALKTQQRVEPKQAAATAAQPGELAVQVIRLAGVQAIGDDQHHRAASDQPAGVLRAQAGQRHAELGTTGKVFNGPTSARQHLIGVGRLKGRAQVGQAHAEGKHVALRMAPGGGMQKGQQQPGVALHRARHIHQHQQRQRLLPALQARQVHQLAASARGAVHDARPMNACTACRRPAAA